MFLVDSVALLLSNFFRVCIVTFFKSPYMQKRILVLLAVTFVTVVCVHAQNYKTAVGLRLSSNDATVNNSISVKHFVNNTVALEGLFSFDPVAIGVLAEVHQPINTTPGLRWIVGGGGFVRLNHDFGAGVQGILGLDYKFINVPLNLTIDWKPELDFSNDFRFEPAAVGLSARFTFN